MNESYNEARNLLAQYGIDTPALDDTRRGWHTVYESLTRQRSELNTIEDAKDRARAHKSIEATEREFLNLYHIKFAEMHPHMIYEEGEDSTYWEYDTETGVYTTLNFSSVRGLLMRALLDDGITPTTAWARECLARYRAEYPSRGHTYDEFDAQQDMLHVHNGWLDLTTFNLTPHTHELLSLVKASVSYDNNATCPTYDRIFQDWEMTQDNIDAIDEFSGNILTSDTSAGRLLVLEGVPGTGKSLLANTWTQTLGDIAVAEYSLDTFTNNPRFCKSAFVGKRLVWFNETDPKRTQMGAELQKMIDGRTFLVERKGVNGYTEHKNMAKCILTTNELPDNMGEGMESRILYIQYTNVFRGTTNEDTHLLDKLSQEASGILNRMIRGLQQYRAQGKYTKIENQEKIMDEYKETSSYPIEFLMIHFDPIQDVVGETFIYTKDIVNAFRDYFKDKVGYFNSPERVVREMYRHAPQRYKNTIRQERKKDGRGIVGLTLKPGYKWNEFGNILVHSKALQDNW